METQKARQSPLTLLNAFQTAEGILRLTIIADNNDSTNFASTKKGPTYLGVPWSGSGYSMGTVKWNCFTVKSAKMLIHQSVRAWIRTIRVKSGGFEYGLTDGYQFKVSFRCLIRPEELHAQFIQIMADAEKEVTVTPAELAQFFQRLFEAIKLLPLDELADATYQVERSIALANSVYSNRTRFSATVLVLAAAEKHGRPLPKPRGNE